MENSDKPDDPSNSDSSNVVALEPSSRAKKPAKRRVKDAIQIREREDPGWAVLIDRIGGREGLLAACLLSQSPKAAALADLILDTQFMNHGTKDLARKAGFTAAEVVDLFRDQKMMETLLVLHEGLPEVVKGAVEDAKPRMEPCVECKGSRVAENGDTCWVCGGKGEVRRSGDKDKLQFIGQASKLTEKAGMNINFNQQINANQAAIGTSFEDLMRRSAIDSGKGKVIDVGTT